MKNYYNILELDPDVSDNDVIKKKYRELCKKYHPDVNSDDVDLVDKIKDINEAYEVISNSEKRLQYDRQTGYNPKVSKMNSPYDDQDQFDMFFKHVFKRRIIQHVDYDLTFLDIYNGIEIEKNLNFPDGSKVHEKLIVTPRQLHQKRNIHILEDGTEVILNYVPNIIKDTSCISTDATDISFNERLDVSITYKLPFISFLKGETLEKVILNKKTKIILPPSSRYGYTISYPDLAITEYSKLLVKLTFDTPNLTKAQIRKIEKIIK